MTEFRFHHLARATLDQALPRILEEALAGGESAIVEAPDTSLLEALDERLWTYADDSFLPHGLARDGDPAGQPVLLTSARDNPNGATLRVLVGGAQPLPIPPEPVVILLFDGRDEGQLAAARAQWTALKTAGEAISYWREGQGGWEKGR